MRALIAIKIHDCLPWDVKMSFECYLIYFHEVLRTLCQKSILWSIVALAQPPHVATQDSKLVVFCVVAT
jgi:hypothetical protein